MSCVDDPVEVLRRWEDAGGLWRVLRRSGDSVDIGLFRCDGGEQLDFVRSDDPNVVGYIGGRNSSLD
jgi:hypothetical protein